MLLNLILLLAMFNLSCLLTLWMDNGHPGLADKDQLYVQHHAPSVPVGKISLGLRSQPSAHQGEILTNQSLAAKLNPKMFYWGKREWEYVDFYILKDGVGPNDETLSSIKNFPRPTDVMGIRSWYGLVEQVAFSYSLCPLLKAKADYIWIANYSMPSK